MAKRRSPYRCAKCQNPTGWKGCSDHECPLKERTEFYSYGPVDHGRKKPALDELDGDWPG